jgi:hypothetical protein
MTSPAGVSRVRGADVDALRRWIDHAPGSRGPLTQEVADAIVACLAHVRRSVLAEGATEEQAAEAVLRGLANILLGRQNAMGGRS